MKKRKTKNDICKVLCYNIKLRCRIILVYVKFAFTMTYKNWRKIDMNYNYKCNNEIIRVFVWDDDFHNEVSVEDTKKRRSYNRTIREDEKGKFFT